MTFVLCNVYAPTREHKKDQNDFIQLLKNTLVPFANENLIIGGDFNFYLNLMLDKIDLMSNKNDNPHYRNEIISMLDSMDLSDAFRTMYPKWRRYTWHSQGKSSRLDYLFISDHLLNDIANFKILPGLHSDHSILRLSLGTNTSKRGKGLWKFNNSLLHHPTYVNKIKKKQSKTAKYNTKNLKIRV